jgi:hypothetical protein
MNIRKAMMSAGLGVVLLGLAAPAGAAIYVKWPDVDGSVTVEGFRWDRQGRTVAVKQAAQPRYKAENGRLVRIDDEEAAEGGGEVQQVAAPVRKPERDEGAVLTRPLSSGPGMLVVRAGWRGCREGARYGSVEIGEGGGAALTLEGVTMVSCSGETLALNYEKIRG